MSLLNHLTADNLRIIGHIFFDAQSNLGKFLKPSVEDHSTGQTLFK